MAPSASRGVAALVAGATSGLRLAPGALRLAPRLTSETSTDVEPTARFRGPFAGAQAAPCPLPRVPHVSVDSYLLMRTNLKWWNGMIVRWTKRETDTVVGRAPSESRAGVRMAERGAGVIYWYESTYIRFISLHGVCMILW